MIDLKKTSNVVCLILAFFVFHLALFLGLGASSGSDDNQIFGVILSVVSLLWGWRNYDEVFSPAYFEKKAGRGKIKIENEQKGNILVLWPGVYLIVFYLVWVLAEYPKMIFCNC